MKAFHRNMAAAMLALGLGAGFASSALAQAANSCAADFNKVAGKRQVYIDQINVMTKRLKGKLDPIGACPLFRNLAAAQGSLVSYIKTNEKWCSIPADVLNTAVADQNKFASIAAKACGVAAQVTRQRKMMQAQQQEQAQGGGRGPANGNAFNAPEKLHLPSGPL